MVFRDFFSIIGGKYAGVQSFAGIPRKLVHIHLQGIQHNETESTA